MPNITAIKNFLFMQKLSWAGILDADLSSGGHENIGSSLAKIL